MANSGELSEECFNLILSLRNWNADLGTDKRSSVLTTIALSESISTGIISFCTESNIFIGQGSSKACQGHLQTVQQLKPKTTYDNREHFRFAPGVHDASHLHGGAAAVQPPPSLSHPRALQLGPGPASGATQ